MDAIEALRTRRSVRVFEDKPVAKETVETIVDCGRLAASAGNGQPWEFVVVTDPETRRSIANAAYYGNHIAQAPVCIAVTCRDGGHFLEDGSAATQNMLLAACALGLGSCWVAGHNTAHAKTVSALLEIPSSHKLVSLIAIGYAPEVPLPPKRPLEQVIHWEKF